MDIIGILGWVAAFAVFLAMLMPTMRSLRIVAIASNLAFIVYAAVAGLTPILVLHLVLLGVNGWRFAQMQQQVRAVRKAGKKDHTDLSWLPEGLPIRQLAAGETLFAKGDRAEAMHVVLDGTLEVVEPGAQITSGGIVGEIGLFAPDSLRTATVVAATPVTLVTLDEERVRALYYDNPEFAWRLVRLITARTVALLDLQDGEKGRDSRDVAG